MSKIKFCEGVYSCLALLSDILQDKINIISKRIGFDDSNVMWIIYNPSSHYKNAISYTLLAGSYGTDYGYCFPGKKQIWISTKAILHIGNLPIAKAMCIFQYNAVNQDLLADVILDEITHIQTGLNHGDKTYDWRLIENRVKYYSHY